MSADTATTTAPPTPVCIRPGCGQPEKSRGLCVDCYGACRAQVIAGKTTWAALETAGICRAVKVRPQTRQLRELIAGLSPAVTTETTNQET